MRAKKAVKSGVRAKPARADAGRTLSPALRSYLRQIAILGRLLDRYANPELIRKSGLTMAEWRVLSSLYGSPPVNSMQLGRMLSTDKSEISHACARLIAAGYARKYDDPEDRRSWLIVLTRSGERLHNAVVPLRTALQKELESALGAAEAKRLHQSLDKLILYLSAKLKSRTGHDG